MAIPISELLAFGQRSVTLTTTDGSFAGTIVPDRLSQRSVMLQFTLDDDPEHPIVIPLDDITAVAKR